MNSPHFPLHLPNNHTVRDPSVLCDGVQQNIMWQFQVAESDDALPPLNLCVAAACVVFVNGKVLLVRHKVRGYEFPGVHFSCLTEHSLRHALRTEIFEQTGAVIRTPWYFGKKVLLFSSPVPDPHNEQQFYPFPIAYVPYFYAQTSEVENPPVMKDITETLLVEPTQALKILHGKHSYDEILRYVMTQPILKKSLQKQKRYTKNMPSL